jgi:hypothetical protein
VGYLARDPFNATALLTFVENPEIQITAVMFVSL